jgi:hypothetical protein
MANSATLLELHGKVEFEGITPFLLEFNGSRWRLRRWKGLCSGDRVKVRGTQVGTDALEVCSFEVQRHNH